MGSDNKNTYLAKDEDGNMVERILKDRYYSGNLEKPIDFEKLKILVRGAKEHSGKHGYLSKTFFEVMYPKRLTLPYRVEDSKN